MAVIASLTRDIVCFVPLVILMPSLFERNQPGSGINGILFAAPAADIIGMIAAMFLTVRFFRTLGDEKGTESLLEGGKNHSLQKSAIVTVAFKE